MRMKEKKSLGYYMGSLFAAVFSGCTMAIIIAITAKIILWMF